MTHERSLLKRARYGFVSHLCDNGTLSPGLTCLACEIDAVLKQDESKGDDVLHLDSIAPIPTHAYGVYEMVPDTDSVAHLMADAQMALSILGRRAYELEKKLAVTPAPLPATAYGGTRTAHVCFCGALVPPDEKVSRSFVEEDGRIYSVCQHGKRELAVDALNQAEPPVARFKLQGELLPGLSFDPATGRISGVPEASGEMRIAVTHWETLEPKYLPAATSRFGYMPWQSPWEHVPDGTPEEAGYIYGRVVVAGIDGKSIELRMRRVDRDAENRGEKS